MSSTSEANKLDIEYGGAIRIQLPSGDFSKIKRLNNYPAIIEYLSKNWSETHTLSDKQLLLIPEKTEFFSKFLSDNGYIIEVRPPKKEHEPKSKPKADISVSAASGGGGGGGGGGCGGIGIDESSCCKDDYNFDDHNEFMKQVEKEIKKTIFKENTAKTIIPNAEQSKLLKKNLR